MENAIQSQLDDLCARARAAARALAPIGRDRKDRALRAIAERLRAAARKPSALLEENAADVAAARAAGLAEALVDRLVLDEARLGAVADALLEVAAFDDPVGEVLGMKRRPNGLLIGQVRIPLGVIAMIYEARPNVTVDAAALCLKSGNAVLLRGGKEAARSNAALGALVREAVAGAGLPADAVQIVPPLGREETRLLVGMTGKIDLVIPRGGEGLIRFVAEHARVPGHPALQGRLPPVRGRGRGRRHGLPPGGERQAPAPRRVQRAGVPARPRGRGAGALAPARLAGSGPASRCAATRRRVACSPRPSRRPRRTGGRSSSRPSWRCGWWGAWTRRSITSPRTAPTTPRPSARARHENAQRFLREVDASAVLVNASTRFNDGGELGLGAEIGISTTKLHAYGPMGLASLTALKWIAYGEGQTR